MTHLLEAIMLCCFGASWPFAVYKTWSTKCSKSKSFVFLTLLVIGYIAGMACKLSAPEFSHVFWLYLLNCIMVTTDLVLSVKYRINPVQELKPESEAA